MVLKSPLTRLFNNSIEECHFPSDLKYANPFIRKMITLTRRIIDQLAYYPQFLKFLKE